MPTPKEYLQKIQQHRSSEGSFETLQATLNEAIDTAGENNTALASALKEVNEKYATAYRKAKEINGNSWPEFERSVAQFEKALTSANKDEA